MKACFCKACGAVYDNKFAVDNSCELECPYCHNQVDKTPENINYYEYRTGNIFSTWQEVVRDLYGLPKEKENHDLPALPIQVITVKCPYCNSTDTKKLSNLTKVGHVALFGIFAIGKVSKQWHCNNCNSDF